MNSDSPWRTRTSVASRPSGMSGEVASTARRPLSGRRPGGSPTGRGPPPGPRIASATAGRHVVVEGEDHQRVLARPGPGQVHRADVHVGLAEHHPDPPDHARAVRVAGDEHHVGRRHVEAVVVEAGDPRLAAGDGPGDRDRRRAAASPDTVSWAAKAPASGVLRSTTVIPRALASAPALTRLTRSVVDGLEQAAQDRRGQRRRRRTRRARRRSRGSASARRRARTGRRTGRGSRPAAGTGRSPGPSRA